MNITQRPLLLLVILMCCLQTPLAYALNPEVAFRTGNRYNSENNHAEAMKWFSQAARAGHSGAKYRLGMMYLEGKGTNKNTKMALMWINSAVKDNLPQAQYKLAELYESGIDVDKDLLQAAHWYKQAAQRGHYAARIKIADWYNTGQIIPQDWAKARYWYTQLANAKNPNTAAQYQLAELLWLGRGGAVDKAQAIKWYQQAAEANHTEAQLRLAQHYEQGEAVAADLTTAAHWYEQAAQQDIAEAQYKIGVIQYQGLVNAPDVTSGIRWLKKAQQQDHSEATKHLQTIAQTTLAQMRELYAQHNYAEVIAIATPKRLLGGEVVKLLTTAEATQKALNDVPELLEAGYFKRAYDLANAYDDPQLKRAAVQAKAEMDKAVTALQVLYEQKSYEQVIKQGQAIQEYSDAVPKLIADAGAQIRAIQQVTELSKKAARLERYMTVEQVLALLGDATWASIRGDAGDFRIPASEIKFVLRWQNTPCPPVVVDFDMNFNVIGWDEGRVLSLCGEPHKLLEPPEEFSCQKPDRGFYCSINPPSATSKNISVASLPVTSLRVSNYAVGQAGTKGYEHFAFYIKPPLKKEIVYRYGKAFKEVALKYLGTTEVDGNPAFTVKFPNDLILRIQKDGKLLKVTDTKGNYNNIFSWEYEGPVEGIGTFCTPCTQDAEEAMAFLEKYYFADAQTQIPITQQVTQKSKALKSESLPTGVYYTNKGYIAALSEENLNIAMQYLAVNDEVAFQKLIDTQQVIFLKGGIKVQVLETKIFSGKTKIRPIGDTLELWTVTEAILDKP